MAQTDIPNALQKIEARDKDVPWYHPDLGNKLGDSARELLENYSKIPAAEVENHVHKIRDEAWQIWPYPCIGGFRFLDLAISLSPNYPTILERLKTGNENFLDLGCCFGQEIRRLVHDGAPSSHLWGADLRPEFFDLGYKLFQDKDTLQAKFMAADIFDPSSPLKDLEGKIDIIYAGSFLHLFNYEQQIAVCKRIVEILRAKKGSFVLGRQAGNVEAGERVHRTNPAQSMFRHNEESFKKMWAEVGEATGTKWKVDVELFTPSEGWGPPNPLHGSDGRAVRFSVWRE
ncbi:methyltransferase domain-containing protein [Stipitochalara longipes BDJ]|nr:methyltransferase domain-containing protein [Stipitochalara longipes BDJ]